MPSAATAAKWQLLLDPMKSWLVIETRHTEATKASCKLCSKWQEKLRKTRNFNDALIRGIEGKALKKDNLEKHELSAAASQRYSPREGTAKCVQVVSNNGYRYKQLNAIIT